MLRGRLLNDNDTASGNLVVVVSESFVRRYLPGMDPLTQRVLLERPIPNQKDGPTVEWQIVGVFGDVQNRERMTDKPQPEVFGSFWQIPWPNVGIAVRTAVDPNLVAKSVRSAVVMAEPTRLLSQIDTIEHRVNDQLMSDRFAMVLFGGFAALALVLAALGIYGVMSFAVAQRRHEIELRMALGAQREQVIKLILTDGLKLALYGVGIGLLGVYGVGLLMRSTLYGVRTFDLRSFVAVVVMLVAAAVIASYVPARRSAKVNPMVALRYE